MPLICKKDKLHKSITTRLATKPKEDISSWETLRTFSAKTSHTQRNARILSGTAIQNSTVKANVLNVNETIPYEIKPEKQRSQLPITKKALLSEKHQNETISEETYDKDSIISGSKTLQDLKNLQKQLRKSSCVPEKPLFEPRRPTIEAIKEAIEKAKRLEIHRHKNVGTDEESGPLYLLNDASTSTKGIKRRTKKKKSNVKSRVSNTSAKKWSQKTKKGKKSSSKC
ncbi:hypothetical protein JTB14_011386 [Gonioctena quinquepunctata]|nr:hypothetical protein JTB14_011386 [Gonioctena quinquepunctata]